MSDKKIRELESRIQALEAWIEECEAEVSSWLDQHEGMVVQFVPDEDLLRDRKKDH